MYKIFTILSGLFLLTSTSWADPDTETFESCASSGRSQDCYHINEANARFDAIEAAVADGGHFGLVIVDTYNDEQVGVYAGAYVFKTIQLSDGVERARHGPLNPEQLPVPNTDVEVVTHWLVRVSAYYDCNGNVLGFENRYSGPGGESALPAEFSNEIKKLQLGALPNGDVVNAWIDSANSLVWAGAYQGERYLDPAFGDATVLMPTYTCVIYVEGDLGPYNEAATNPFNMTATTTLYDFARTTGVVEFAPTLIIGGNWLNANVPSQCAPDDSSCDELTAKKEFLRQQCNSLAGLPDPYIEFASCQVLVLPEDEENEPLRVYVSTGFKSATYTTTTGITAVTPTDEVPGNRGEPRNFGLVWK